MKYLVTGASGFLGRHLCQFLSNFGSVYGVGHGDWCNFSSSQFGLLGWENGDIDEFSLERTATEFGLPDVVFHLAGGSTVGASISDPKLDFNRTVVGTANLCEWVRKSCPKASLIMASSSAVYGAAYTSPISESDAVHPFSPYGFNKYMAEQLLESYSHNYGIKTAVVRFFSIYGNHLKKQLLWDLCTKLNSGSKDVVLGGSGEEIRDWMYVADAVELLYIVSKNSSKNGFIVNGGTGIPTSINDVAKIIIQSWGSPDIQHSFSGVSRSGDPPCLLADTGISRSLGFSPAITVDEGIPKYVSWFRSIALR